jgi:hypothetical protein
VRDYLDGVAVQMDGSFVAGYELDGLNSYYHDDDMRNRSKRAFEALVRSLPERSMRMQVRFRSPKESAMSSNILASTGLESGAGSRRIRSAGTRTS